MSDDPALDRCGQPLPDTADDDMGRMTLVLYVFGAVVVSLVALGVWWIWCKLP